MASHREGVNPLRPYYKPPTIGEPSDPSPSGIKSFGNSHGERYASKARDMLSDIDYKDYISDSSPSAVQTVKELVDELLWKYTSILMAQPFEVAKTVLQVRSHDEIIGGTLSTSSSPRPESRSFGFEDASSPRTRDYPESDSDPDEPAYFTSNASKTPSSTIRGGRRHREELSSLRSPRLSDKGPPSSSTHQLNIRSPDSVSEVIGQLWQKEGAWGVWKGSNATFLYSLLSSVLENWSRSALSALFNVPDLGVKDDIDRLIDIASPYPWASLGVAVAAAISTGLMLAPLDMVRTRLLLTPSSRGPRRTLSTLRALPSYLCPPALVFPTILHSLVHPLLTLSTPLVLRTRFLIDRQISPGTFSLAKFCASTVALFIKLPLETVLRRGQVAVLSSPAYLQTQGPNLLADQRLDTIVPAGRYEGFAGTMLFIMNEEGKRAIVKKPASGQSGSRRGKAKVSETVYRRGQGADGLFRGWKVSWWGLVGLWAAGAIGNSAEAEF